MLTHLKPTLRVLWTR